ncbi:MAG: hypothetical protein M3Q95_11430 [Bacteroidota bacterium]|nr:hypothetical protein [Bacteroidota bacterium]
MKPGDVPYMKTLSECLNSLVKQGYSENFCVKDDKLVGDNDNVYSPGDVRITNFYRFEGSSDPADNAILYAIQTDNGICGVLVDAYGSEADSSVSDFIKEVSEMNKKENT